MRASPLFFMGHTQASRERPTMDEMKYHEAAAKTQPRIVTWKITGVWSAGSDEAIFEVTVKGEVSDVHETYEMLTENGNLHALRFDEISGG